MKKKESTDGYQTLYEKLAKAVEGHELSHVILACEEIKMNAHIQLMNLKIGELLEGKNKPVRE